MVGWIINPTAMWVKTGTVAINGWQALRAHYLIVAMEMKDALADAEANLLVITKADVVAAKGVSVSGMTGVDIKVAVHAVFIASPQQTCTRTSIGVMAQGIAFLNALLAHPPRPRSRCVPGRGRCRHDCGGSRRCRCHLCRGGPPAACRALGARHRSRGAVDVDAMSKADQCALLAKLTLAMDD